MFPVNIVVALNHLLWLYLSQNYQLSTDIATAFCFDKIVILSAHDNNANFPIPFSANIRPALCRGRLSVFLFE